MGTSIFTVKFTKDTQKFTSAVRDDRNHAAVASPVPAIIEKYLMTKP